MGTRIFRPWAGSIRYGHRPQGGPSGAVFNPTGTPLCRSMRPWISKRVGCTGGRQDGLPAKKSFPSWTESSTGRPGRKRFPGCRLTSRLIEPRTSNAGSPGSTGLGSPVPPSLPSLTSAASFGSRSEPAPNPPNRSAEPIPARPAASPRMRSPGQPTSGDRGTACGSGPHRHLRRLPSYRPASRPLRSRAPPPAPPSSVASPESGGACRWQPAGGRP